MPGQKTLLEYQTQEGRSPFYNWMFSKQIDHSVRDRILMRLDHLSLGNPGDCRPVGSSIFEMRLHFGPGYRIYFGQQGEFIVILLCGGDKSTQIKDIAKAKAYWGDFKLRAEKKPRYFQLPRA